MNFGRTLSFFKKPLVAGLLVFSILLLIVSAFIFQRWHNFNDEQTLQLQRAAYSAKERLEKALEYCLSATETLSFVVTKYDIEKDFDEAARNILENNQYIDALALTEGGVVKHIYPYNENASAIGFDILKDNLQKREAVKAMQNKMLYFAGPVKLQQGYTGVIGRLPIFIQGKFWGFSSAIIKLSTLTKAAQMDSSYNSAYLFQLSKINPNTGKEEFFLPHPEKFTSTTAVSVNVPKGDWKIYARFVTVQKRPNNLISLYFLGVLFSFTVGFLVWFFAMQPKVLEKMVDQKTSELKQSEEKFRVLVEQNLVAVFIIQGGRFKYSNPGFEDAFGYTKNELLNIVKMEDVIHPDDLEKVQTFYAQRTSGKNPPSQYTIRVIRKDGVMLHAEVIASPIIYEDKPAVIGTAIDITGRIEEEKRISKAVTEAQERERMQIGMELHDNVKQIMAATLLNLEYLQMHLDDKQMASERIGQLMVYMREAIYDLRRLSHQLAPSLDSSVNLYDKLDNLVQTMLSSRKMSVEIEVDEFSNKLSSVMQLAVYRILQEQIANALKHADAGLLNISVRRDGKQVAIVVKDNGKGFDPDLKKEGIGLENIRRRAQALDGTVKINSSPGKGFELIVEIPVI